MARKKITPDSATASAPKTAIKSTRKRSSATATKVAAAKVAPRSVKKAATTTTRKKTIRSEDQQPAAVALEAEVTNNSQSPASLEISSAPLTGDALVKRVKELGNLSKVEKAKVCGYSGSTKKGAERVNLMKFYNALIDAEGIDLDGKSGSSTGRGGRSASYRITVQSNGNLLIGAAYTKLMDLHPGDEFQITLGRKHIRLTQLDSSGNPEQDDN